MEESKRGVCQRSVGERVRERGEGKAKVGGNVLRRIANIEPMKVGLLPSGPLNRGAAKNNGVRELEIGQQIDTNDGVTAGSVLANKPALIVFME